MTILSLKLHPFAGSVDRDLTFRSGLNVVLGPNEAGKSTVFQALRHVVQTPARLTPRRFTDVLGPFMPASGGIAANYLNIPFGGGIKYGLSRKVTIGMEWILKKSFSDDIDGVKSFGQFNSPSLVHNNDWVSLAGFFITIKPFDRRGDCPAYWN